MPRIASITAQGLTGFARGTPFVAPPEPDPPLPPVPGAWTDDQGNPVTVRAIIGAFSLQLNGVFSVNPSTPFTIQGGISGAQTTALAVTANTGTFIEIDDTGNSTSFVIGEQLVILAEESDFNVDFGPFELSPVEGGPFGGGNVVSTSYLGIYADVLSGSVDDIPASYEGFVRFEQGNNTATAELFSYTSQIQPGNQVIIDSDLINYQGDAIDGELPFTLSFGTPV